MFSVKLSVFLFNECRSLERNCWQIIFVQGLKTLKKKFNRQEAFTARSHQGAIIIYFNVTWLSCSWSFQGLTFFSFKHYKFRRKELKYHCVPLGGVLSRYVVIVSIVDGTGSFFFFFFPQTLTDCTFLNTIRCERRSVNVPHQTLQNGSQLPQGKC